MLTDRRLRKYLEGRLPEKERAELESLFEKKPALRARLEALRQEEPSPRSRLRDSLLLQRRDRAGGKVRFRFVLPALLFLLVVLLVGQHWFSRPGQNSTFVHHQGTGHAVDLLYRSAGGWRYFDAGFRPADSLSLAVRDSGRHAVLVLGLDSAKALYPLFATGADTLLGPAARKPVFALPAGRKPSFLTVLYAPAAHLLPAPETLDPGFFLTPIAERPEHQGDHDYRFQTLSTGL